MTRTPAAPPKPPRSRRWTRESGLPHLAAQLPRGFRSPTAVNSFIYSLAAELTAGRVDSRTAAVLGYLSQLAIQTLPLLRIESGPEAGTPIALEIISSVPRPNRSVNPATLDPDSAAAKDYANKRDAYLSLHPRDP